MAEPFTIAIPDERLTVIRTKVQAFDWSIVPDAGEWRSGVGLADLRCLVDHWLTRYDWRAQERRLNALPQFTTEVQGHRLHFVHARGDGSRPPLLLLHGWPGSFLEFEALISPLVADGHDVVVPSLPGFAFSGRPASPIGPKQTAELMHGLMVELFGAARYLVQGGDWGAAIGAWMAHDHPDAVAALHLNMVLVQAEDALPKKPDELAWAARRAELAKEETGYSQEQGSRPQTLGVAMSDSPVGVAAWILEKFGAWADVLRDENGTPDLWQAFDADLLLTNVMLYLVEGSFVTSTWMYRGRVLEGSGKFPAGTKITVPTAVAAFPDPVFPPPPRSQASKTYNIVQWTDMAVGGHFAALEQPELLLADMRRFFSNDILSDQAPKRSIALPVGGIVSAALGAAALYTRYATARIEAGRAGGWQVPPCRWHAHPLCRSRRGTTHRAAPRLGCAAPQRLLAASPMRCLRTSASSSSTVLARAIRSRTATNPVFSNRPRSWRRLSTGWPSTGRCWSRIRWPAQSHSGWRRTIRGRSAASRCSRP